MDLNVRALRLTEHLSAAADDLRIAVHEIPGGGRVYDFGVAARGGLGAGLALAQICTAGLAEISLVPGEVAGGGWPHLLVATDHPVAACLLSQYAGWQIGVEKFFAMGSGPMRAASAREEVFKKLDYREQPEQTIGVLEGRTLPTQAVFNYLAERTGVPPGNTTLAIAPTASQAGTVQVVARVVETALHKLFELGYDVRQIESAYGTAPLAPVAKDDLTAIGRTNDAILYGGRVTLWVRSALGEDGKPAPNGDDIIREIGPKVPASATACYGRPFLEIFEEAGRDFYKIDKHLFSPAEITFHNLDTGRVHRFGQIAPEVLTRSFA